jgi:acetyl-CoA decarbonylase/synthase complex subunit gamma
MPSGIEILKMLPKTNCGDCGQPTCLAFAMNLAAGKAEIDACPHISDEAKEALSESSAPPIREVTVGAGAEKVKVGGETVLFRHEKTFFNKPGFAVLISDSMSDDEVNRKLKSLKELKYDRVGLTLRPELCAVESETGDKDKFAKLAKKAVDSAPGGIILISTDPAVMESALSEVGDKKPLIYAATADNLDAMGDLALKYKCPLTVKADGVEAVAELTGKLIDKGHKDLVIDPTSPDLSKGLEDQVNIRRLATKSKAKELGFPTIVFPAKMTDDYMKEMLIASMYVAKYAGIIVLSDFLGEGLFPLLLERLNVYTDPQRPMMTEEGLYPINNPADDSPLLVTSNFSLTYFIVSAEIEGSRVPSNLLVLDTEGLSVLTAWAAGKFAGDLVAALMKKTGIKDKQTKKKVIIPGYVAVISGELEEDLGPDWEVIVGPREAAHLPRFLKELSGA